MAREKIAQEFSGGYKYGFHDKEELVFKSPIGLTKEIVLEISKMKGEPEWMAKRRLSGLEYFISKPLPSWGPNLSTIDFSAMSYYAKPSAKQFESWEDVPAGMKNTFERLGIPEAERKFLAGVGAQYDSEVIYHNLKKSLEEKGVVFTDMDSALREHEDVVKKYFGTIVPASDNKFAALNTAVWSGGSFVHIPSGVSVDIPLQAYFRINAKNVGQFERTMIIAEPGSSVHYIEGCFTKGTRVTSMGGVIPIERVKVRSQVLTHNCRYRHVKKVQRRQYSGNLYKISYFGDSTESFEATSEHPFLSCRKERLEYTNVSWKTSWTEAEKLKKGDYLAIPIDRSMVQQRQYVFLVEIYDPKAKKFIDKEYAIKSDANFFRLIGYYLSEGSTINGHYLSFTFNAKEREYIDDVKSLLKTYFGKEPLEQTEYNHGISIVLCSTLAVRIFAKYFGNHAGEKRLPYWVLHESLPKQSELVKGFWRGDGSYMKLYTDGGIKVNFRMNSISPSLARSIRDILLRLDIFASLNCWKKSGNRHDSYALTIGGTYLKKFASIIDFSQVSSCLDAFRDDNLTFGKVSYARIIGDYAFVPIRSIMTRKVKGVDVYNLSVDEDESYVAGGVTVHNCSAPIYSTDALHAAVVEIIALPGSQVRYTTIQNWSSDVYNLVTKRAKAYRDASVEWIDGNIGSRVTMKYPCIMLMESGARGEVVSVAFAGKGQIQDAGAKVFHLASNTSSNIISKSLSKDGGRTTYRGLVSVPPGLSNIKCNVECDALILDGESASDTVPCMDIASDEVSITHEATVSKLDDEKLFYLQTRGFSLQSAKQLLVSGFVEPFVRELPMEYAVELNRLLELEMEGSVG